MKKEIVFRMFRIVLVTVFLLFSLFLWKDANSNYESAKGIIADMPSFTVTSLNSYVDTSNGLMEKHKVDIKNVSNGSKNISFVLNNVKEGFPYDYMNYTIIKNNKIMKKGIVKKGEPIYKEKLTKNENSVYTIVFSMSKEDVYNLGGVSVDAKLVFI